jgi:hypothetical protein
MPEEPTPAPKGPEETPAATTPPTSEPPAGSSDTPPVADASAPQAEPLSDGTVPTVLTSGSGTPHAKQKSGRASLTSIYRRADVMTTILTFAGAVVAGGLILAGYAYFTKSNTPTVKAPKLSQLDPAELEKLATFFNGNTPGTPAEVLTISSSSLFKNRVGISSDLKVVGGVQVSGPTAVGDLTVDKTSTLGVTNIRGQLTVAGPITVQSPALLSAGASVTGNVTASGNGTFGGSLSAGTINTTNLAVTGVFNLANHLSVTGQAPAVRAEAAAGSGASASIDGSDTSGTVVINSKPGAGDPGELATITFHAAFAKSPHVIISPSSPAASTIQYYVIKSGGFFAIGISGGGAANRTYTFDYWVVQ